MLALRTIAGGCVFAAILGFSRFSFGLLLPPLMHEMHGPYGAYGAIAGANFAGYLLGTAAIELLLKTRDDIRFWNAAALVGMGFAMLATAGSTTLWQIGMLRFLVGLCSGIGAILTITIALDGVAEHLRGLVSGGIWAGGGLGVAVCGALVNPHAHFGWRAQYTLMATATLATVIAFAAFRVSRKRSNTYSTGAAAFHWNVTLLRLAAAYALFGFGYIVYMVYASSYRLHTGQSASAVAFSWLVFGAGGAAGALVWGKIFDRYRSPLTLCAALALCAFGVIADLPFLTGMAVFGTPAIVSALARDVANDAAYTKVLSRLTACFGVGQIAGPLGAGFVIDHAGLGAGIPMTAAPLIIAAMAACVRRA